MQGVWGPYYSGMLPGLWLNEGGQSAAGAAIDYLLASHPAHGAAMTAARAEGLELPHRHERLPARLTLTATNAGGNQTIVATRTIAFG